MSEVNIYHLKPTKHIPNSPYPLLHYPGAFPTRNTTTNGTIDAGKVYDTFAANGWQTQWIYRYGSTQQSHYHSHTHECMAVLSGHATIRFGAADVSSEEGIEIHTAAGDVFVIPSGVAHKTFGTTPRAEFSLLTPGDGQSIQAEDPRAAVASTQLGGFTMMGAYPLGSSWDFKTGLEDAQSWSHIWRISKPDRDPVLGSASAGLCGLWQ